jgi:hypothetical protein
VTEKQRDFDVEAVIADHRRVMVEWFGWSITALTDPAPRIIFAWLPWALAMRFAYVERDNWPELAWLAKLRSGDPVIEVHRGRG